MDKAKKIEPDNCNLKHIWFCSSCKARRELSTLVASKIRHPRCDLCDQPMSYSHKELQTENELKFF